MRWKIDENIHPAVAALLQGRGHDAVTVWGQNLQGASDRRLAKICLSERRALLTLDLDFANILAYPPEAHAGIVVLRLSIRARLGCCGLWSRRLRCWRPSGWRAGYG